MIAKFQPCVYCKTEVAQRRGNGDHVVPAALGRFKGEFILSSICRDCNSKIGRCEEQLIRCGPGAHLVATVAKNRVRSKRGYAIRASSGALPPRLLRKHDNFSELVTFCRDGNFAEPVDQLVANDDSGRERHVLLSRQMTAQSLHTKLTKLGITSMRPCHIRASCQNQAHYELLIKQIWPKCTIEDGPTERGTVTSNFVQVFYLGEQYWRSLAKIAFHYYILNGHRGYNGHEPAFHEIKSFIMTGGDHRQFVRVGDMKFVGRGTAPVPSKAEPKYFHILAADDRSTDIVVNLCLFASTEHIPLNVKVRLGRPVSDLLLPFRPSLHIYRYHEEIPGFDGSVEARPLF